MPVSDTHKRGLNGTQLKYIGIVMMLFDHIHQMFYMQGVPDWFVWIGRPVAPLFIFLCSEGFFYTHSKKRYMLQLLGGSLFMSIVSPIVSSKFPSEVILINNIFSTLFLATVYMLAVDYFREGNREKSMKKILTGMGIMILPILSTFIVAVLLAAPTSAGVQIAFLIPNLILVEGGAAYVFLGMFFYIFKGHKWIQCAGLAALSILTFAMGDPVQSLMLFAAVFILLYNGERGKGDKYFFYIFYPAHIYILYILSYYMNK